MAVLLATVMIIVFLAVSFCTTPYTQCRYLRCPSMTPPFKVYVACRHIGGSKAPCLTR